METQAQRRVAFFGFFPGSKEGAEVVPMTVYVFCESGDGSKGRLVGLRLQKAMLIPYPEMSDNFEPCDLSDFLSYINRSPESACALREGGDLSETIFAEIVSDPSRFLVAKKLETMQALRERIGHEKKSEPSDWHFLDGGCAGASIRPDDADGEARKRGRLARKPVLDRPDHVDRNAGRRDLGVGKPRKKKVVSGAIGIDPVPLALLSGEELAELTDADGTGRTALNGDDKRPRRKADGSPATKESEDRKRGNCREATPDDSITDVPERFIPYFRNGDGMAGKRPKRSASVMFLLRDFSGVVSTVDPVRGRDRCRRIGRLQLQVRENLREYHSRGSQFSRRDLERLIVEDLRSLEGILEELGVKLPECHVPSLVEDRSSRSVTQQKANRVSVDLDRPTRSPRSERKPKSAVKPRAGTGRKKGPHYVRRGEGVSNPFAPKSAAEHVRRRMQTLGVAIEALRNTLASGILSDEIREGMEQCLEKNLAELTRREAELEKFGGT